jgi:hypothetical protein
MTVELRRVVSQPPVTGTPLDPLYVVVQGISIITYNKPGSVTSIAQTTKTTIVSDVYLGGVITTVPLISCSGTGYAKYFFQINGSDIDIRRTGPGLNLDFNYTGAPFSLSPGDVVSVAVEHFNGATLEDFEATIYGYA